MTANDIHFQIGHLQLTDQNAERVVSILEALVEAQETTAKAILRLGDPEEPGLPLGLRDELQEFLK